jgi:hypothetical protein
VRNKNKTRLESKKKPFGTFDLLIEFRGGNTRVDSLNHLLRNDNGVDMLRVREEKEEIWCVSDQVS